MMFPTLPALAIALLVPPAPLASPTGSAPADTIRAATEVRASVLRNTADVRRCYEAEGLPRNPALRGRIQIALTIEPTGIVSAARVDSAQVHGPGAAEVARCIVRHARNWRFDRGPYDVEVHLFPFDLVPEPARPVIGTPTRGA
jgi:hypothetical protein